MRKTNIAIILSMCLLSACTTFKKDYVITDASRSSKPKWVKKEAKDSDNEFHYFVSYANNANQRLCEKSAIARATAIVAGEIANTLVDNYNENNTNENENINSISKEDLQQDILMYISGVKKAEGYWEKRRYSSDLGAIDNKTEYKCYALMKMDKDTYQKVMDLSTKKMLSKIAEDNTNTQTETNEMNEDIENE